MGGNGKQNGNYYDIFGPLKGLCRDYLSDIPREEPYWDNGKENGSYSNRVIYVGFGV